MGKAVSGVYRSTQSGHSETWHSGHVRVWYEGMNLVLQIKHPCGCRSIGDGVRRCRALHCCCCDICCSLEAFLLDVRANLRRWFFVLQLY